MKLTDTELVEREKPKGGVNFICDGGVGKTYRHRFLVYCEYKDNRGAYRYTIGLYFNEDMSDELYDALEECLGEGFIDNLERVRSKVYNLETQRIGLPKLVEHVCPKLVAYVLKYIESSCLLTTIYKLYYQESVYNMTAKTS